MDKDRFDSITKAIAAARSRREAIGSLLGGAVAGAAGLLSQADNLDAKAKKQNAKAKKQNGGKKGDSKGKKGDSKGKKEGGGSKGKVTICHKTGSASNPYVEITVSEKALKGHRKHDGDIIPAPAGGCPKGPSTPPSEGCKPPKVVCNGRCVSKDCSQDEEWDQGKCECKPVRCENGKEWCKDTHECVKADCGNDEHWDSEKCRCKPNDTTSSTTSSTTTKACLPDGTKTDKGDKCCNCSEVDSKQGFICVPCATTTSTTTPTTSTSTSTSTNRINKKELKEQSRI